MSGPQLPRDQVREALVAAASRGEHRRLRNRRRQMVSGVMAGVVVALLGAALVLRADERPSAAIDVERTADGVRFSWSTDDPSPPIEEASEQSGLEVTVERAPVGPSQVGAVLEFTTDDPVTKVAVGRNRRAVEISGPVAPVTLTIGRIAVSDEEYFASSNAFAEEEPLECSGLAGASPSEVVGEVEALGLEVRWQPTGDSDPDFASGEALTTDQLMDSTFVRYRLGAALMTSERSILIFLTVDGGPPSPQLAPEVCGR